MAPESVGPYRIVQKLGSGGMGDVYLAEDTRLGRQVALKSLTEKWARVPDARRRLVHEARAAAGLNHSNVAAIYDVVETAEASWIVMEYAPGESLAASLRRGPLTPEAVVWVGVQICDALGAAHARNIIHRDLKPANLMLSPEGHLKVLDFGLAKSLDLDSGSSAPSADSADLSDGGRLVGTLPYVPPEHIVGERVDERSDLYSAGVVLFELLSGRRPYDGADKKALAQAIVDGGPPDLQALRPDAPADLVKVVKQAMAREPSDRPPTAGALRAQLDQLSGAQSGWKTMTDLQRPLGVRSRGGSSRDRRRVRGIRLLLAGGLVALGLAGFAFYRLVIQGPPPESSRVPAVAVLPLLDASGDPAGDSLGLGFTEVLVSALSRLPRANVLSRATTAGYRDRTRNAMRIAGELGVDFVLDGVVQRSADKVRVTLSLIQAPTGIVIWGDVYDGLLSDPFGFQSKTAQEVAGALRLRLAPEDRARLRRGPALGEGAFADYARARELLEEKDVAGNLERSVALFEKALRRDPGFALAEAGLGQAAWLEYMRTRDPAWANRASEATRRALSLDPAQPLVRVALAEIYLGTGRAAEAEPELNRAIAQQPDNDEAHETLGRVEAALGRKERSLLALRRAVELRPGYWRHIDSLGVALFDAGRLTEAADAFRSLTALRPESVRGFHQLGTTYQALGDRKAALDSYHKALALDPDADTWSNVGTLLYDEGRLDDAAQAFSRAVALQPAEPRLYRNLGDAYGRLGRKGEAEDAYRKAVQLTERELQVNPKDPRNWGRLAVYHAKLGERSQAVAAADRAVAIAPSTPDVLYYAAVARALTGQSEEAVGLLGRAFGDGFSREFAQADDDLAALRKDPSYVRLMSLPGNKK